MTKRNCPSGQNLGPANDDVPQDEMLLAEAVAAAVDRGMKWAKTSPFYDALGCAIEYDDLEANTRSVDQATSCCALGALHLAGRVSLGQAYAGCGSKDDLPDELWGVYLGNDSDLDWPLFEGDEDGASLGWAFRCAMTQDEVPNAD